MLKMFHKRTRKTTLFQILCGLIVGAFAMKYLYEYRIMRDYIYSKDDTGRSAHSMDLYKMPQSEGEFSRRHVHRVHNINNNPKLVRSTVASQQPRRGFEPQLADSVNNTNNSYKRVNSKLGLHQPATNLAMSSIPHFNQTHKFDRSAYLRKYRLDMERFKVICAAILQWSNITNQTDKDSILNRHQFSYSLTSNICKKFSPKVIIFVQSATKHFGKRTLIRRTWAAVYMVKNITFRTVFMLGQTDERTVQQDIEKESSMFGDMVQGNFMDAYKNLTYKHVMALGWITEHCPDVKLIVKVDDDTILNIFNLVDYLSKVKFKPHFLSCSIYYHQGPVRRLSDKWYVNISTYPFEKYPDYCEGFGYLMSPDVARSLYKASESTKFYWVDDVYVTGILALKIGLHLKAFLKGHSYIRSSYSRLRVQDALFISPLNNWDFYWKNVLTNSSIPESTT